MIKKSDSNIDFQITDTDLNFEAIYQKKYIPQKYLEDIRDADVLLIPYEGPCNQNEYYFSSCTSELYSFLKRQEVIEAEICIDDRDYKKRDYHSDFIDIGMLVVRDFVLPLLVGFLVSFINDKIKSMNRRTKEVDIHIIVDKDGKAKRIDFKGCIEDFKIIMDTIKDTLFKEENE